MVHYLTCGDIMKVHKRKHRAQWEFSFPFCHGTRTACEAISLILGKIGGVKNRRCILHKGMLAHCIISVTVTSLNQSFNFMNLHCCGKPVCNLACSNTVSVR